jgi:hypothetical protein
MMRIKNWNTFQHFKDRRPPWIKLHRDILDRRDINSISDRSFRVLVCLWLLASEDKRLEGNLPCIEDIAFRVRLSEDHIRESLQELTHFIEHDDDKVISEGCQHDAPETETEIETEEETEEENKQPSLSLVEIQKVYSDTFKDLMPSTTIINRLQWFIDNFDSEEILSAFEGASSGKIKSINWITARFKKIHESRDEEAKMWADMGAT